MKTFPASVIANTYETRTTKNLVISPPSKKAASSFKIPGQYVSLTLPGHEPATFALSSAPGDAHWSLLIKNVSPLARDLFDLKGGDSVKVSAIRGRGFDLKKCRNKNLILVCVGSGIAPIQSVINHILNTTRNPMRLFYGVKNTAEFASSGNIPRWRQEGVAINLITSGKTNPYWQGPVGRVTDLLTTETVPAHSVVLLCGMPTMIEDTQTRLLSLGIAPQNILLNI